MIGVRAGADGPVAVAVPDPDPDAIAAAYARWLPADPANTELASTGPASTEPASTEPAGDHPVVLDPVVVEVASAGICGSDFHLVELGVTATLGHEFAGYVDGRPVAVEPLLHCHGCGPCRRGRTALCEPGTKAVHGIHLDGGMADRVVVDRSCLVELPDGVDPAIASLCEPIAVGLHGVHRVDIQPGMRVLVIGAGMVGLVAAALARRAGADVDIVGRHAAQFVAAERLGVGAAPAVGSRRNAYDVVIEAVGQGETLAEAVDAAQRGGRVALLGTHWAPVEMPGMSVQTKEVDFVPALYYGHHAGRREFDEAAEVLALQPELVEALVTHRFPLEDAAQAFRTAADREAGAIRVLLNPAG